jgi:phospholipid/cholesterol/gamma-HCH transport system ATP-binding protein
MKNIDRHKSSSGSDQVPVDGRHYIVRLVKLRKSFGTNTVLHDITLNVPRGKTSVVLGPSGCGKSVMLKHIAGLLKPDSGEVWFENTRVDQLSESRLAPIRREIGFLFQQSALFDSITVAENVSFPLREQTNMKQRSNPRARG